MDVQRSAHFELIERISQEALAAHPAWTHFEPEVDRDRLLGWGVSQQAIEEHEGPFVACGLIPLYPVLETSDLKSRSDVMIAARFTPSGGPPLDGYLLEPHAFGVFHGGHEYSFNRNLPGFSGREAVRLARVLDLRADELFPMTWALDGRLANLPGAQAGSIAAFW